MIPEPASRQLARAGSTAVDTGASLRLDLRGEDAATRRERLIAAFAELAPEQGLSFLSTCDERALLGELARLHGGEVEAIALEDGPERWDIVVSRVRPGVRRRQVLDFMQADHFRIDDLMVRATHQAQRGDVAVHATCRQLAAALRGHLRMEEDLLMPVVAQRLGHPRAPVFGLGDHHRQIEKLLDQICASETGAGSPRARVNRVAELAEELEEVLLRHIGVEEAVVYAVTDLLCTCEERDALLEGCRAGAARAHG